MGRVMMSLAVVVFLSLMMAGSGLAGGVLPELPGDAPRNGPAVDDGKQAKRLMLATKAVEAGLYTVTIPGILPRIVTGPIWDTSDYGLKNDFVSVVYAYYYHRMGKRHYALAVRDRRTNKTIGVYDGEHGRGLKLK